MFHVQMAGKLPKAESIDLVTVKHADGQVVLTEVLHSSNDERLYFQILAVEQDLKQDVLIEARPSKSGHVVELSHFGSPATTRLVRDTVGIVAEWLERLGMRIVERAY